jgi:hypothetical protein
MKRGVDDMDLPSPPGPSMSRPPGEPYGNLSIRFEFFDEGYGFVLDPPGTPWFVVVEVLMGFLQDIKAEWDASPVLNPDDARAWQMLGSIR